MAIGRNEGARVFWIAFATTSALYLVFAHIPDSDGTVPRHNGPEVTTQLLRLSHNWLRSDSYDTNFSPQPGGGFFSIQDDPFDSRESDDQFPDDLSDNSSAEPQSDFDSIIESINKTVGEPDEFGPAPFPSSLQLNKGGGQRIISSGDSISFMRIGHSAWALLLGWIAGHFTRFIYERSRLQPT